MSTAVRTGLEALPARGLEQMRGRRVGLVSHAAAVNRAFRSAAEALRDAPGVELTVLFGPEHGLAAVAQDLERVASQRDALTGLPVVSLYGDGADSLMPAAEHLRGLDVLVIDLVDVGSRYYTFQATMLYCLQAAGPAGLDVMILDRPNPLGGLAVEGPTLAFDGFPREGPRSGGFTSFVGAWPMPVRHGLTMGELATMYHARLGLSNRLEVVRCEGWRRDVLFPQTGLPWVMPSPNMPTFDTALVYPGMCLIEGTNLSEGRGTTRPFELVGFPGIDAGRLVRSLRGEGLPGVTFRPAWFKPTFQKHAGRTCGGCQLHVTDPVAFHPVRTGLAVLAALRREAGAGFAWRSEPYEFVSDRPAIDLLFGSDRERLALEEGRGWREIAAAWESEEARFGEERRAFLLYE